jgi:starch phosphorylase
MHTEFTHELRIVCFSMEIALRSEIPTCGGGLGVLAGDTIRAAADMELPMVAVTLISHQGYFRHEIDPSGRQTEHPDAGDPAKWTVGLTARVAVTIEQRDVWVGGRLYVQEGHINEGHSALLPVDATEAYIR